MSSTCDFMTDESLKYACEGGKVDEGEEAGTLTHTEKLMFTYSNPSESMKQFQKDWNSTKSLLLELQHSRFVNDVLGTFYGKYNKYSITLPDKTVLAIKDWMSLLYYIVLEYEVQSPVAAKKRHWESMNGAGIVSMDPKDLIGNWSLDIIRFQSIRGSTLGLTHIVYTNENVEADRDISFAYQKIMDSDYVQSVRREIHERTEREKAKQESFSC